MISMLYLPLVFLQTLLYMYHCAGNAVYIFMSQERARHIWYAGILVFSTPSVAMAGKRFLLWLGQGGERRLTARNTLLVIGIATSHLSTIGAWHRGAISLKELLLLVMYDLVLIATLENWTANREGVYRGIEILAVLLWLTAVYGIVEHFIYGEIPFLYSEAENSGRIISVFRNTIVAGSAWLIGFWLPFPTEKKWLQWAVKLTFVLAIFFTISKNAWLGLAFSLLVYTLFSFRNWDKKIVLTGLLMGLVGGVAAIAILLKSEYFQFIVRRFADFQTQGSVLARLQHIQDTWKYMTQETDFFHQLIGWGYATSWEFVENSPHCYGPTFRCIDNQYFTSWFEFGLISVVCLFLWGEKVVSQIRSDNKYIQGLAISVTAMLIPMATYDPFRWEIVMIFLIPMSGIVMSEKPLMIRREVMCGACVAGAVLISEATQAPVIIRVVRTTAQFMAESHGWDALLTEGVLWSGVIICTLGLMICCFRMGVTLKKHNLTNPQELVFLIRKLWIVSGISATLVVICHIEVLKAEKKYAPLLEKEREVMEILRDSANGKICVDQYPELYQRKFGHISGEIFRGDGVIRADETTVISESGKENRRLLNQGFLFLEMSEAHVLYTDDTHLIEALQNAGYHLTGYYNVARWLKLADGHTEEKMWKGEISLYNGNYSANVTFGDNNYSTENTKVYLTIWDKTHDQLSASGELTFDESVDHTIEFSVSDDMGYATVLNVESNYPVEIEIKQLVEYDVHNTFDYTDRLTKVEYYTTDGIKTLGPEKCFAERYSYNKRSDRVVIEYLDENDQLTISRMGCAVRKRKYDRYHRFIKEKYYGTDGEKVALASGEYGVKVKYNDKGLYAQTTYLGKDDSPVLSSLGYAQIRFFYDEWDRVIREEFYDEDLKPLKTVEKPAAQEYERDLDGRVVEKHLYAADGESFVTPEGWSAVKYHYSDSDTWDLATYFDADDKQVLLSWGYSSEERVFDSVGNLLEERFLDIDGNLCMTAIGYACVKRSYDENARIVLESYWDEKMEPVNNLEGFHELHFQYDTDGTLKESVKMTVEGTVIP